MTVRKVKPELTPEERADLEEWLDGLSMGLYHDGKKVRPLGRDLSREVTFTEEEGEFHYCLYAIKGNASLRLRAEGRNGNKL